MPELDKKRFGPGCPDCGYFENDPGRLESVLKGLTIFCSAYASVRGDSGICHYDDRFRMPRTACEHFTPKN